LPLLEVLAATLPFFFLVFRGLPTLIILWICISCCAVCLAITNLSCCKFQIWNTRTLNSTCLWYNQSITKCWIILIL